MADMRRRGPEPPPGRPEIQFKPGMAGELLRELAPLLAEEGIDVDNIALALTAATQTWAADSDTPVRDLARAAVR